MNQMKTRLMAAFLSCVLCVSMMSVPAYAADIDTKEETKKETIWKIMSDTNTVMAGKVLTEEAMTEKMQQTLLAGQKLSETEEAEEEAVVTEADVKTYVPRFEAPMGDNPYYHELNLFYNFGLGMPNCTAYAYGRAYEILGTEPMLSNGNAGRWWFYNLSEGAYACGSEPRLGAIACWDDYDEYNGHVAVVEAIDGNRVTLSESQYGGENFCVYEMEKDSSDHMSWRRFLGYIYIDEAL